VWKEEAEERRGRTAEGQRGGRYKYKGKEEADEDEPDTILTHAHTV
jgi:hypothetical protein